MTTLFNAIVIANALIVMSSCRSTNKHEDDISGMQSPSTQAVKVEEPYGPGGKNPDGGLAVQTPPTKSVTIRELVREQVLLVGQSFSPVGSPVEVRLVRIDVEAASCLLEVKNKDTDTNSSGWVHVNDFAGFAPKEVGTHGLEVAGVAAGRATLRFHSSDAVEVGK